jgi:hypothetical protein
MRLAARALLALAGRLMPDGRREWLDAMRAEVDYLHPVAATRWAFGCVHAALRERINMKAGDFRISRWVMLVETAGCFGFLTLGWFIVLFGPTGLVRLTPEIVSKHYLSHPGGGFVVAMIALGALVGLVGPIGSRTAASRAR